jgi:hypothetical protein
MCRTLIVDELYPLAALPYSDDNPQQQNDLLFQHFKLGPAICPSTGWVWLVRSGFSHKPRTKRFLWAPMSPQSSVLQRKNCKASKERSLKTLLVSVPTGGCRKI